MLSAVWLIPALPLAGFLLLVAFGRKLGNPLAGWLATAMVGLSFLVTLGVFSSLLGRPADDRSVVQTLFSWVPVGRLQVKAALLADPLSLTMALFVTGVGALIHLYSIGYMHRDERYPTFFVYMNLFAFSMLMLVLADNFLLMFLGWEGVGACSYFLISFWFTRERAAVAGKKAFVTNRVGDWGFMVAMFLIFTRVGSLAYGPVFAAAGTFSKTTATAIALLLFVGAIGKSAQLPLYVWLPDAMEGPTPVSALIHAATMVTAGVYLMARVNPILVHTPEALTVVAVVGVVTALFAATIACAQDDIKKVLAYSTISQLGYMFLAVGCGAYVAAVFHMVTHAFFKALLFLGAGAVIHGLHDEQDMKRMGALRKWMPVTSVTFIVGWLAIAGIPPFSGFWSKDDILVNAWDKSPLLWAVGVVTALLTAYYMSRQVFLVFFGDERWRHGAQPLTDAEVVAAPEHEPVAAGSPAGGASHRTHPAPGPSNTGVGSAGHRDAGGGDAGVHGQEGLPHEAPWTMTLPLIVLAVLATVGGVLNLPFPDLGLDFLERWLEPVFGDRLRSVQVTSGTKGALMLSAVVAGLLGIWLAYQAWLRRRVPEERLEPAILQRAWGVDAAYAAFMGGPGRWLSAFLAFVVDARGVDGAVNGVGSLVRQAGARLRRVQSGYVRNYALGVAAGAVLILAFMLFRVGG